jgi:hypothetical protein
LNLSERRCASWHAACRGRAMFKWLPATVLTLLLISPTGVAVAQTPQQPQTLQPSSNWSGYVAGNAYYTGVSALIQAGVEEVNQGPFVTYQAWYEMLPELSRNVVLTIEPGAWVGVDVHEIAYNRWRITIINGTNVFQRDFVYASSHSSAEWVVEEPALWNGQLLPLAGVTGANFGNMRAVANGVTATPPQLFPQGLGIVSRLGALKAAPSGLGPDGTSFSVVTV